jgi:hypothetical protein
MSTNDPYVQSTYSQGGFRSDTATNIGRSQASQNQPCTQQQHNEPFVLFQQRQDAYNSQKKST